MQQGALNELDRPHLSAVVLLGALATGCGGAVPASVVTPKDPTPLAKCDVAKSNARPLVTEWPASEKAHLESLVASQAVIVSYSGCEMRLLDSCRLPGTYGFQRTSISNDTIEITNADELYAKIPLGAAGLEGELSASGRLAIETTVVGQFRLEQDVEIPDTPACRSATHVISSISIGAFEMKSGGAMSGRAGVALGDAGAGVSSESRESSLKSSGNRAACSETTENPHPDCQSPLQVFLRPVSAGTRVATGTVPDEPPRPRPEARPQPRKPWDQPPADNSVTVRFEPPEGEEDQHWILLSQQGDVLCERLPCTRRVGNRAKMQVQLDAARKEDIRVFPVPDDLGYTPGRTVRAVPDHGGSNYLPSLITLGVGLGVGGGGLAMLLASNPGANEAESASEDGLCDRSDNGALCTVGALLTVGGGITALVGVTMLLVAGNQAPEGSLDITLLEDEDASLRLDLRPSGLSIAF